MKTDVTATTVTQQHAQRNQASETIEITVQMAALTSTGNGINGPMERHPVKVSGTRATAHV